MKPLLSVKDHGAVVPLSGLTSPQKLSLDEPPHLRASPPLRKVSEPVASLPVQR